MFNVTVLKMKDIIKYLIGISLTIILIIFISKNFGKTTYEENKEEQKLIQKLKTKIVDLSQNSMLSCLEQSMPTISSVNQEYKNIANEDDKKENIDIFQTMLKTQIGSIRGTEEIEEKELEVAKQETNSNQEDNQKDDEKTNNNQEDNEIQLAKTGLTTEVITNNPIKENSNSMYGKVKIKNETDYNLTEEMLKPDITVENKNIVLFHTHSCESYTSSEKYPYTQTGNFRTTDLNYTVARLGDELTNYLLGFGFKVNHDKTYHDYPAYTGSYSRSLESVKKDLQETSSDIIIDLHRDAIGSKSNYDPSVKIGDDVASQLMFVIGTNGGGLYHPNWQNNLRFAIKVQEIANEMYPGLFKPMIVRNSRYNQHLGKAAVIIEVGSTGNTLEQSLTSMKYLAKVFEKIKN